MKEPSPEFVTMLIEAVAMLAPIVAGIVAAVHKFTKPINELNTAIVKLTDKIEDMTKDFGVHESRITRHGTEIDELKTKVTEHDVIIENFMKGRDNNDD